MALCDVAPPNDHRLPPDLRAGECLEPLVTSRDEPQIDSSAAAAVERLAYRTTGSATAARRAVRAAAVVTMSWRAVDRWPGSDRDLLYRALLLRPSLLAPDIDDIGADAGWLPRLLLLSHPDDWVWWAVHRLGGVSLQALRQLSGATTAMLERQIDAAQQHIERHLGGEVLLVAADPLELVDLRRRLESLGHHVFATASDRNEAIHRGNAGEADLIVVALQSSGEPLDMTLLARLGERLDRPMLALASSLERADAASMPSRARLMRRPYDDRQLAIGCTRALLDLP